MFIVIYLAVKKRKLFHTFESSAGKGVLGIYIICWLVFFTINWVKFNNQTLN